MGLNLGILDRSDLASRLGGIAGGGVGGFGVGAERGDRADADYDDKGHHDCVFDVGRAIFAIDEFADPFEQTWKHGFLPSGLIRPAHASECVCRDAQACIESLDHCAGQARLTGGTDAREGETPVTQ